MLDEIHKLLPPIWEKVKDLPPQKQKEILCDEVEDILILSCIDGEKRAKLSVPVGKDVERVFKKHPEIKEEELDEEIVELLIWEILTEYEENLQEIPQIEDLKQEIKLVKAVEKVDIDISSIVNHPTKGETFRDRIIRRIDEGTLNPDTLKVIAETESHRCEEDSAFQTIKQIKKGTDLTPYKIWVTMDDDLVRATHDYIDHDIVELDEYFVTFDGDRARWPGDFENADNNVNCRCWNDYIWI